MHRSSGKWRCLVHFDGAWASVEVDKDQLKGAAKNFFTALRWVDISGIKKGVNIILQDAPLFEMGRITTDAVSFGWLRKSLNNGAIYSYVMNNYWETNYKADQPGITEFRYSLFPHNGYSVARNMKESMNVMQPLLVLKTKKEFKLPSQILNLSNPNIIIESIKPHGEDLELNLVNLSNRSQDTKMISQCNRLYVLDENKNLNPTNGIHLMGAHETHRLICSSKF